MRRLWKQLRVVNWLCGDGFDLRGAALVERKRVLREFMKTVFSERIRYCDHVEGDGAAVLEAAC